MRLFVNVKPRAREGSVEKIGDNEFIISVKEPPVNGMANQAVIRALSEYLKVFKSQIRIVSGAISRKKIVEISD